MFGGAVAYGKGKPLTIKDAADITQRKSLLVQRFDRWHQLMRDLDDWRFLDLQRLKAQIFEHNSKIPDNADKWLYGRPDILSVTETVTAFLSGRRVKSSATPKNTVSTTDKNDANSVERIGYALWDTIDRDRDQSLLTAISESNIHRGAMVAKAQWLSPEERGEVIEWIDTAVSEIQVGIMPESKQMVVIEEGCFPLLVKEIDPLECYWTLGNNGRVIEFLHEFKATPDALLDIYPDICDHEPFSKYADVQSGSSPVTVIDYWNESINAILINDYLYKKPTEHDYGCVPVVVELAKPRMHRYGDDGMYTREGTPFCAAMLPSIKEVSRADTMLRANLDEVGYAILTLSNWDPGDSMYAKNGQGSTTEFAMDLDIGPNARIVPLQANKFGGEKLEYLNPPKIVDLWEMYKSNRMRDMALVSFQEGILTGAYSVDLSGYSVSQQKQAAMARVAPYELAENRFLSRLMNLCLKIMLKEWDRDNAEYTLVQLVGQKADTEEELKITRETLESVASIRMEVDLEVPTNREQESQRVFQAQAQGLMSIRQAIEELGVAQDPQFEFEDVIAERYAMEDQQVIASILGKWMKRNGYEQVQQKPQLSPLPPSGAAPLPSVADGNAATRMMAAPVDPMMAMGGGMPADPMAAQMGADPMMGGVDPMQQLVAAIQSGQIDPAMLQQLMGGQAPPMGL